MTRTLGLAEPRRAFGLRGGPLLGQSFDELLGVPPYVGNLMRMAAHGATSYLGLYIGIHEDGFLSAIGWIVGVLQGMGFLVDVLALATDIQDAAERRRRMREEFAAFPQET
jgi:hypothetical protein